ncbi:MAG: DUF465 domain-containing protein [Gammaproteobacteria bacterium]|nr:DUF465 domain-containing protein [Gammaproteobacteria bacterium]
MLGEHHNLAQDMPEYKEKIHELKVSDSHFAKLLEEYDEVNKEILRIEEQIETPDDNYTEKLKLKRVNLKDELTAMLKA